MITKAKKIAISRRITQFLALIVLNLPFLGLQSVCAPVFYCHSCPLASMACPLGVLVNFSTLKIFPFVTLGILGLVGVIGGRIVCGWLCPFGLLQDLLHKIPGKKFDISHKLTYVKYAVLVGLVFAVPFFWPGAPYTFCHFCPSAGIESTIPWMFMGYGEINTRFFLRMGIVLATLAFAVFVTRGFCRMFCPLGAFFGLFNRFSLFRFNLAHEKCNTCGACRKRCPIDMDPVEEMNTSDCIRCLDCTTIGDHIKIGHK
jgi:ferredoxin-type protein NapH